MRIRTKLVFFPLLYLVAIVFLAALSIVATQATNRNMVERNTTDQVAQKAASLDALTHDYVLYRYERSRQQWWQVHGAIASLIPETPTEAHAEALVAAMREHHAAMGKTFGQITSLAQAEQKTDGSDDLREQRERRLVGQLLLHSQALVSAAFQLSGRISARMVFTHHLLNAWRFGALALSFVAVTMASVLVARSITRPLASLQAGTKALGGGDLSHAIEVAGHDEVADLAHAFNKMARSLEHTQSALRLEIEERRHAQDELQQNRDQLEALVARRTCALEKANLGLLAKERALQHALEDVTRSNKELEQFAYVASHDLQEPLRKIRGFTELLAKHSEGSLDEKATHYMAYVTDGAMRMQGLIEDLLHYSRAGRTKLELTPTELSGLVTDVLDRIETAVREADATIEVAPLPTLPVSRRLMAQVFQNLIANAIKFRGPVAPRVHISAARRTGEWVFSVNDNGIGMDPKYHERVFQVFQRLHSRSEYAGTGIGLAVCMRIVERHGGRIWIESEEGKGCTFLFTIPDPVDTAEQTGAKQQGAPHDAE